MDAAIIRHLSKDAILADVIARSPLTFVQQERDVYFDLLQSIISQQLSVKAADTIFNRFLNLFDERKPVPTGLLRLEIEQIRATGVSGPKAVYLQNVARFFVENNSMHWQTMSDEAVLKTLTSIKGVGQWTTEMILMFSLGRPDILPVDDVGIRNTMQHLYGLQAEPAKHLTQQMIEVAEPWRPYRTYACRYLWHWKDNAPKQ